MKQVVGVCFLILAYSSTLRLEAKVSSETLADFQRTTRRCNPKDRTLQIMAPLPMDTEQERNDGRPSSVTAECV
jgi:hypothetical protein